MSEEEEGRGQTPNTALLHGQAQIRRGMTWLIPLFSGAESAVRVRWLPVCLALPVMVRVSGLSLGTGS